MIPTEFYMIRRACWFDVYAVVNGRDFYRPRRESGSSEEASRVAWDAIRTTSDGGFPAGWERTGRFAVDPANRLVKTG